MPNERNLVTGATGLIGRALVQALIGSGEAVRVLTRGRRPLPAEWIGRVELARSDLTEPGTLTEALRGCHRVFHLAGELRDIDRVWAVNADGTRHLLEAARRAAVRHVVHMSSVGVMGAERPGTIDESEPCAPHSAYEQSKLEAERMALAWAEVTGATVTALRPTIVFGVKDSREPDSLLALLTVIQQGRFVFFDRAAEANYVYVEDVVGACLAAMRRPATGTFIVADPCPLYSFIVAAADALGVPAPRRRIPRRVALAAAAGLQVIATMARRPNPLTATRVRALSSRTRFASTRIDGALGWRIATGYRAGLGLTVQGYRQASRL